jgi:MoaA/NifB/PqqE/SkfB family radical SAM enzyme
MWFHIRLLEACNLHCPNCYARDRDRSARMDLQMFRDVLQTILRIDPSRRGQSVIYLSGGEPLIHPDILQMVDESCRQFDRVNILSNGIGVVGALPRLLPFRDKLCVQVSLDGDQATNDAIRGVGAYDAAVAALHALKQNGLQHWISYTVCESNRQCYERILDVARATDSQFNNVTPYTGEPELMVGYLEWKEFKYRLQRYAGQLGLQTGHGPNSCGFNYDCGAFYGGVTVNPDGTLAGCARVNEVVGSYRDMQRHLRDRPRSMHETCMKARWGEIRNFRLLTRIEC